MSAALVGVPSPEAKSVPDKVIGVGYQKYGSLILLKGRGELEGRLASLGFKVQWKEFPSGPPLLEALNAGAIDFGHAGKTPPIFAQAAGVPFVYVAYEPPSPKGEAILVRAGSPLKTLADLRSKRIALNKGSNVHYLLFRALEYCWDQIFGNRASLPRTRVPPLKAVQWMHGSFGIRSAQPQSQLPARARLPMAAG